MRKKKSTVDEFHHQIFNIVQKNLIDQNYQESDPFNIISESNLMNSSENMFREKAEEVLEANTYNNHGSSNKRNKEKDIKNITEILNLKSSNHSKEEGITMVKIKQLRTR